MKKRTYRQRQRRVYLNLVLLVLLLVSSSALYLVLRQSETGQVFRLASLLPRPKKSQQPTFAEGSMVMLGQSADESLSAYRQQVGQVVKAQVDGQQVTYTVRYGQDEVSNIGQSDLKTVLPPLALGQSVALVKGETLGESADGQITGISVTESAGQLSYIYQATFPTIGQQSNLVAEDFVWMKVLAFSETNTAAQNNAILQEALEESKSHTSSRLIFPSGRFMIGSQTPEQDYIKLASNVALVGNETTLLVEGAARWFGVATGPEETDGLSNFTMKNLTIEASDLVHGNQFIIMANHGQHWHVEGNRFVLVHKMSSHIFDLGGVQEAIFTNNSFEGYAPELTSVTEFGSYTSHNVIAEAIQLDASSDNGEWDGGLLKAIDPDYAAHNPKQLMSHDITISDNQFMPYWTSEGVLIAYSAGVGQHSSGIGYAHIYNNVFTDSLSLRFQQLAAESDRWLFDPVHVPAGSKVDIYANWIN